MCENRQENYGKVGNWFWYKKWWENDYRILGKIGGKLVKKSINDLEKNENLDGEFIRLIQSLIKNKMIIHAYNVNKKIWINVNNKIKLDSARKQFN